MPSTVVRYFEYDTARSVLRVTFQSGMVYDYQNVPPEVYNNMKDSFSKGTFLNTKVKGHYRYEKIC